MDLQISVFLLFILFTAGHSLRCYSCSGSCANQTVMSCPRSSQCASSSVVAELGFTIKLKDKDCSADCQSGSFTLGNLKVATSCCNTDQCNAQDPPDPSNVPNGKTCYTCDGLTCTNTLKCTGTEDRCITAKATASGGLTVVLKGCASKSICDGINITSAPNVESITCCEGNMCNGAPSVSQSFLFLCCSLLSYFLLH